MLLLLSHMIFTSVLLETNNEFLVLHQTPYHIIIFPQDRYFDDMIVSVASGK